MNQTWYSFHGTDDAPQRLVQALQIFESRGQHFLRQSLEQFIAQFIPQQLLPNKNYYLHLNKDGTFSVRLGIDGEEIPFLSETEQYVFHYLCFLQAVAYWDTVCDQRQGSTPKPPLLIHDFSGRLDESINYELLLKQGEKLGHDLRIIK